MGNLQGRVPCTWPKTALRDCLKQVTFGVGWIGSVVMRTLFRDGFPRAGLVSIPSGNYYFGEPFVIFYYTPARWLGVGVSGAVA